MRSGVFGGYQKERKSPDAAAIRTPQSRIAVQMPGRFGCILWFLAFVAVIPFADLRGAQGPVPWWGRLYMVGVSLVLAGILASGFWSLGQRTARAYFGLVPPPGHCG